MLNVGDRVEGVYLGNVRFAGTIRAARRLNQNGSSDECMSFTVSLDQPITSHGGKVCQITICTKPDGSSSSYTKHTDHMMLSGTAKERSDDCCWH